MKGRRASVLAVFAFVVAALAGPASAMAENEMLHEGEPISEEGAIEEFSGGPVGFANEAGGINCATARARVSTTRNSSTAHVTTFRTTSCVTTGLLAAFGCELASSEGESEALPWTAHITNNGWFTITQLRKRFKFLSGCPFGEAMEISGEVTATPDNSESIGSITLSGTLVSPSLGEFSISGSLEAENPGTYGIG